MQREGAPNEDGSQTVVIQTAPADSGDVPALQHIFVAGGKEPLLNTRTGKKDPTSRRTTPTRAGIVSKTSLKYATE